MEPSLPSLPSPLGRYDRGGSTSFSLPGSPTTDSWAMGLDASGASPTVGTWGRKLNEALARALPPPDVCREGVDLEVLLELHLEQRLSCAHAAGLSSMSMER